MKQAYRPDEVLDFVLQTLQWAAALALLFVFAVMTQA